jgi:hypothetical protein
MDKTSPAQFHKNCDQYAPTVTVAHNAGGPSGRGVCRFESQPGCSCRPPLQCIPSQGNCVPCTFSGCGTCDNGGDDCGPVGSSFGPENPGNFTFGGYADATWSGGGPPSGPFDGGVAKGQRHGRHLPLQAGTGRSTVLWADGRGLLEAPHLRSHEPILQQPEDVRGLPKHTAPKLRGQLRPAMQLLVLFVFKRRRLRRDRPPVGQAGSVICGRRGVTTERSIWAARTSPSVTWAGADRPDPGQPKEATAMGTPLLPCGPWEPANHRHLQDSRS